MRRALVALLGLVALLAVANCGDNAPVCGHVELLSGNRNIWGGHIAVDDERVYYSDYDNATGMPLVFRQPRDGGQELVIDVRPPGNRFGYGMASDGATVFWAAEDEARGYTLFATPALGGAAIPLGVISACTVQGVAFDAGNVYAGSERCNDGLTDVPARVITVTSFGAGFREIWTSTEADVIDIAARDGVAYLATTGGLVRVADAATELIDARPIYHVAIAGDELVYSTEEQILARPRAGGAPRTVYTFTTPITQPRAFAIDGTDLYIAEPPEMLVSDNGGEAMPLVHDMGGAITHIVARDGYAYWPTLAVAGSLGIPGSYSGAVLRVARPCL